MKDSSLFSEGFDYNEEERYDCKGGELFGNQRRFPGHLFWDFQVRLKMNALK